MLTSRSNVLRSLHLPAAQEPEDEQPAVAGNRKRKRQSQPSAEAPQGGTAAASSDVDIRRVLARRAGFVMLRLPVYGAPIEAPVQIQAAFRQPSHTKSLAESWHVAGPGRRPTAKMSPRLPTRTAIWWARRRTTKRIAICAAALQR